MENEELKQVEALRKILIGRKWVQTGSHTDYYSYGGHTKVAVDEYTYPTGVELYEHSLKERRKARKELRKILKNTSNINIKKDIKDYFKKVWGYRLECAKTIILLIIFGPLFVLWGLMNIFIFVFSITFLICAILGTIGFGAFVIYLIIYNLITK